MPTLDVGSVGDVSEVDDGVTLTGGSGGIQVGPLLRDAIVDGPYLNAALPAGEEQPPRMRLQLFDVDNVTPVLDGSDPIYLDDYGLSAASWQDTLNQTGVGKLTVPVGPLALVMARRRYVQVKIDERPVFPILLESPSYAVIQQGEEAEQVATWSGRGSIAEWESARVYPVQIFGQVPYSEDGSRTWNFSSPSYGDWRTLTTPGSVSWRLLTDAYIQRTNILFGSTQMKPWRWPDPFSQWIWSRPNADNHPPGTCYFLTQFTIETDQNVTFFLSADDDALAWLNGVPILRTSPPPALNWQTGFWAQLPLEAGTYRYGITAENRDLSDAFEALGLPSYFPRGNLAGVMSSVWVQNNATYIDDPIVLTVPSSTAWFAQDYPAEPPGWYAGEIVFNLWADAFARDHLTDWTFSFGFETDSAGRPWSNIPEFTTQIGNNLLQVLEQLADSGWIDFAFSPAGKVLHMWDRPSGGRGSVQSLVLANTGSQAADNIAALTAEQPA